MELSGIQSENTRPESSGSGLTATDSHGVPTELSPTEEEGEALLALENSGSSEDGRMQPLLKQRPSRAWQVLRTLRHALGLLLANWYKFVILGLIITMIVLVSIHGFSIFGSILQWFKKRNGWGGWGVFIGFYTVLIALFFPGVVFIMGAGFIFGFWRGLLAVWIGGAVGQALAFLLARYLLRDWVETFVRKKLKKWKYIDAAIESEGWKLVLVMRLSPIIPYNILNIAMATTRMHFWSFALVSAIGVIFECAVFTYIGTMAESITSIASGEAGPPKAIQWVFLGLSLAMAILGTVIVSVMVKRAIRKAEEADAENANGVNMDGRADSEFETLLEAPSMLEREDYMKTVSASRTPETRSSALELRPTSLLSNSPEKRPPSPSEKLASPPLKSPAKAKSSPKAIDTSVPFAVRAGEVRDLEMGASGVPLSMTSNRRRSANRAESDDDGL